MPRRLRPLADAAGIAACAIRRREVPVAGAARARASRGPGRAVGARRPRSRPDRGPSLGPRAAASGACAGALACQRFASTLISAGGSSRLGMAVDASAYARADVPAHRRRAGPARRAFPTAALPGPFAVGRYAAQLRERLREFAARAADRRAREPARGAYARLLRAARRRRRDPLRRLAERLGEDARGERSGARRGDAGGRRRAAATTTRAARAPRRPSRSTSPTCAIAGEGDLLAQIDRLRKQLDARGPARAPEAPRAAGAAAHDRGRDRRERQGPRRPAGGARAARLGRAHRVGVRAGPGPPRGARDRARARRPRRPRRRRGHRRRARRRLARRPALLLRRDALPDRRAAGGAGDRLGRSPHRPHAARRRRRGELLDAHPCGRGGRRRRLRRPRGASSSRSRSAAARARRGACSPRASGGRVSAARLRDHGRRAVLERARRLALLSRAPGVHVERERGQLRQKLREIRAGSRRRLRAELERTGKRALVVSRKSGSTLADCRERRPRELERLALALAAHDPQRTLERGYALAQTPRGPPVISALAGTRARRAAAALRRRQRATPRSPSDERARRRERARPASGSPTRPRPHASRRSSGAWTPARRASTRRSRWSARASA